MLFNDTTQLKAELDIDPRNPSEDKKLNFYLEFATNLIEEVLNRPGMSKNSRTEFYDGSNTMKLLLKSRPVYTTPTIQAFVDGGAFYGATSGAFATNTELVYGTDFCLKIDQPDGTSRSGILVRMNGGVWYKRFYRQTGYLSPFVGPSFGSIKILYTGGYTVDNLPPIIREACTILIARMRTLLPIGADSTYERYEERAIGFNTNHRNYLLSLIKPMLWFYRNHTW